MIAQKCYRSSFCKRTVLVKEKKKNFSVGWNGPNKVTTGLLNNIHCNFPKVSYDLETQNLFHVLLDHAF